MGIGQEAVVRSGMGLELLIRGFFGLEEKDFLQSGWKLVGIIGLGGFLGGFLLDISRWFGGDVLSGVERGGGEGPIYV